MVLLQRDQHTERVENAVTAAAAIFVDVTVGAPIGTTRPAADMLSHFAGTRIAPGPVQLPDGRSLPQEAREELADARNYLTWEIIRRVDEDRDTGALYDALGHVLRAWQALEELDR